VEGAALAAPAPLDLRANRLLCTREALQARLGESVGLAGPPALTPLAPDGLRIPWRPGRAFAWAAEPSFLDGWFEVQDEGSQLAALLAGVGPGQQVADVCAGGGGKTLALAAAMANRGQIYAHDVDGRRLAPLKARAERGGVRNVQLRFPVREGDALGDLAGRMDCVLVDAPCTGSGTWRRAPDAKWRVRPGALAERRAEQQEALALAAPLVRPGGLMVYVTCSVLPAENAGAVAAWLGQNPGFSACAPEAAAAAVVPGLAAAAYSGPLGLQLTPARTGSDGFFISVLQRSA
jgi:16S rRNA (cytosine967-C5)-methyltransferase